MNERKTVQSNSKVSTQVRVAADMKDSEETDGQKDKETEVVAVLKNC